MMSLFLIFLILSNIPGRFLVIFNSNPFLISIDHCSAFYFFMPCLIFVWYLLILGCFSEIDLFKNVIFYSNICWTIISCIIMMKISLIFLVSHCQKSAGVASHIFLYYSSRVESYIGFIAIPDYSHVLLG